MPYTTMVGQATDINWQTTTGTAMLESNYGATLMLPAADAGARMEVTYRQKSEQDYSGNFRRVPLMVEEMAAPATAPYTVDLAFRGIDEMNPLYSEGIDGSTLVDDDGNALDPQQVYVLIVDLASGATWTDVEPWVSLDFREGQLQLNWDDASAPMAAADARGLDLRVYYRTIDGHTIVVQKAPDWYVEDAIYQTYADPYEVDYRTYQVTDDPDDNRYTQLLFPLSAGDQIVMIDYVAGASPPYERISGELHAIPGDTLAVTLNRPDVRGILAVRGVSMTVRGWWHEPGGRVEMVGIDTFLTPESLL
jgi:hypothetical protein